MMFGGCGTTSKDKRETYKIKYRYHSNNSNQYTNQGLKLGHSLSYKVHREKNSKALKKEWASIFVK